MPIVPLSVWVQAVILLLKNLPAVINAIQQGVHRVDIIIQLKPFVEAEHKAEETKNTDDLENIFNPKPNSGGSSSH